METHGVLILALVAVLAITGLVLSSQPQADAAAVARPLVGDECSLECPEGLEPAKLKQYNGYLYCACGTYQRAQDPENLFEYEVSEGKWVHQ